MAAADSNRPVRRLAIVLGDQLNHDSAAFEDFDREQDAVLMMEVDEEATVVPQHKTRLVLFFSAMRHFRDDLCGRGMTVRYSRLEDDGNRQSLAAEVARHAKILRPQALVMAKPGDHRVEQSILATAAGLGIPLEVREDSHFLATPAAFARFAAGRKSLVMETFYRGMRRRHAILMDGDRPLGGRWNYDTENRETFGKQGPGPIRPPRSFAPDATTREVMAMVGRRYPDAPGALAQFDYPVQRQQAKQALDDFIDHRLARFGRYQDAMVTGEPFLYHSRLSSALNLHLLNPREVIEAACKAYEDGRAPLSSVEGFVRQILGWREYVRGIYWLKMPGYAELNALEADLPMPAFMWTGETEMNCIRQSVGQLHEHAYAHHIQRLMVLGLFAMLLGVRPYAVHQWHMSMYVDAIDWVSLPNVLGMSQYGDGGIVGSKPYAASGNYVARMSDYCSGCRYDPRQAQGERACPFTTLYWDFLGRHERKLRGNPRMGFQLRNLDRKGLDERRAIRRQARALQSSCTRQTYL